jgi:CheY-like chemotaxis protein
MKYSPYPEIVTLLKTAKTVFMIDDDMDDQEIFTEVLSIIDPSIPCLTFKDARQALYVLQEEGVILPGYIFVDLNMPRMNGFEFLIEIKGDLHLRHIPVFIYTTSSESAQREKALRCGAAAYIVKPSNMENLRKELEVLVLVDSHS